MSAKPFVIEYRGKASRFATLGEATARAQAIFDKTGIIVAITQEDARVHYDGPRTTLRRNPTLAVVNPPRGRRGGGVVLTYDLAWAAAQDAANRAMRAGGRKAWSRDDYNVAVAEFDRLIPLLPEADQLRLTGKYPNPPLAGPLASKVLRMDYVHHEDGKEYTHDFTEDAHTVEATVDDDGRRVTLRSLEGERIVEDF